MTDHQEVKKTGSSKMRSSTQITKPLKFFEEVVTTFYDISNSKSQLDFFKR